MRLNRLSMGDDEDVEWDERKEMEDGSSSSGDDASWMLPIIYFIDLLLLCVKKNLILKNLLCFAKLKVLVCFVVG